MAALGMYEGGKCLLWRVCSGFNDYSVVFAGSVNTISTHLFGYERVEVFVLFSWMSHHEYVHIDD